MSDSWSTSQQSLPLASGNVIATLDVDVCRMVHLGFRGVDYHNVHLALCQELMQSGAHAVSGGERVSHGQLVTAIHDEVSDPTLFVGSTCKATMTALVSFANDC